MPNPRYLFRSTDNECEAVMSSLLAIKHWKGQFKRVAGINPDYSYGRNNMAAFVALLKRFNIEHEVVTEQWPKVGTMDLTSHVAALKAAKPDLIFSSLLFADLPVFMKQAHAAELTKGTKLVFPAAGWQHTLMKKDFTPEGMMFGHNTLYFDNPERRRRWRRSSSPGTPTSYKDYPNWEADRAYFAIASYKAAVEAAAKAKGGSGRRSDDVIDAMVGLSVESLGGKGSWRKDHIADQTFVQGFTTHKNKYDFVTLDPPGSRPCTRPTCRSRPAPISGSGSRPRSSRSEGRRMHRCRRSPMSCSAASFTPPCCFWSRPACSSCSACRRSSIWPAARSMRWAPISASRFVDAGAAMPACRRGLLLPVLIVAGAADGVVGPPIERVLRTVYDRDESFQLLLTFALVLMFQDVFRFIWGANPRSLDNVLSGLRHDQLPAISGAGLQSAGDRRGDRRGRR